MSKENAGGFWRSVGAIVAGIIVLFVISMGTDAILHAVGIYPREWMRPMEAHLWGLALGYRVVYGAACAYLVAALAPSRAMWHAMVFGGIGVGLSVIGVAIHWNQGEEFGPMWFNLGLVAIALPCSWIGGKVRVSQLSGRAR